MYKGTYMRISSRRHWRARRLGVKPHSVELSPDARVRRTFLFYFFNFIFKKLLDGFCDGGGGTAADVLLQRKTTTTTFQPNSVAVETYKRL